MALAKLCLKLGEVRQVGTVHPSLLAFETFPKKIRNGSCDRGDQQRANDYEHNPDLSRARKSSAFTLVLLPNPLPVGVGVTQLARECRQSFRHEHNVVKAHGNVITCTPDVRCTNRRGHARSLGPGLCRRSLYISLHSTLMYN